MPIKKIPNLLDCNARSGDYAINIFTNSKKEHFTCSISKIYDQLEFCIKDRYKHYQLHLTTYPTIAVHITGNKEKIQKNEVQLRSAVVKQLEELHDRGKIKI